MFVVAMVVVSSLSSSLMFYLPRVDMRRCRRGIYQLT